MNGLWTVEFISTLGRGGSGVIVLNDGRLLGGDAGYYYVGQYTVEDDNNAIRGEVVVTRFEENHISVFGNRDEFSLQFRGDIRNDSLFEGAASLVDSPDQQMRMKCRKKEDL